MKKLITYTSILALFLLIGAESFSQYCIPSFQRSWTYMSAFRTSGGIQDVNVGGVNLGYNNMSTTQTLIVSPGQSLSATIDYVRITGTTNYNRIWIDYNGDGSFGINEEVLNSPRYSVTTAPASQTVTYPIQISNNMNLVKSGLTRMRVRAIDRNTTNPCWNSTWGGSVLDINVLIPPAYSSNVAKVISPTNPVCPGTLVQDLTFEVCNDGLERIDSVLLGGIIKTTASSGQPLPPIYIPNVWRVDSMLPNTCKQFKVYTHAPGFKTNDTITIWTSMPNGVPDSMDINDTITFIIAPTIVRKKWSVGDTTNGLNDFKTLGHALDSFGSIGGLCDSLIIELDTSHNANISQYDFPLLYGSSSTSPIIIRAKYPEIGRSKLTFDSCDVDNNYIVRLDNVAHLFFENIDFYSKNGFTTDNSQNILMENGCNNINIINCGFKSDYANASRKNTLIMGENMGDNISITGCDFVNGSDGVFITGGSSHSFTDSKFIGTYLSSIHVTNASNIEIAHNDISSLSANIYNGSLTNQMGIGIYVSKISDDLVINNNIVKSSNSQWPRFGIHVENYNRASGVNWIFNNFLNIGQAWSGIEFRGISMINSSFTQIANNNIAINGNSGNNEGMYYDQGTGNAMWNNIISIEVAGVAVRQANFGQVTKSDYNNLYAPGNDIVAIGGTGGGNFTTLAAYQTATSLDMNSKQLNPFFYNTKRNDLHVCNNSLSTAGLPLKGISEDFDGDVRDINTPSIGADEFTPISDVKLAADYGLCPGSITTLTAGRGNFGETAIWKSVATGLDLDTNQSILITTPGQYAVTFFNACGVVVDTIEIITPDAVSLPNDTNMCFGTTLNVDATIVGGTSYMWNSSDSTALVTVSAQSTYSITAADNWGCLSSDTFDVTYSPAADFGLDSIIVCEGASQGILSNVDGTIGANFTWSGYTGSSTNRDPGAAVSDFELPSKRAYVKVIVDHKGCISEDSILMKILGRPVIDISDTTNGLLFKVITNNSPGATHSWDFGDGDTSNFRLPKHIYAIDGVYTVEYSNSNQCRSKDTTFEVTVKTLNILENISGASLTLYPNPNNGVFNLDFKGLNANDISVSIVDINGRTVYNETYGTLSGNNSKAINLADVATGFYTISVEVDGATYQEKFIVQ